MQANTTILSAEPKSNLLAQAPLQAIDHLDELERPFRDLFDSNLLPHPFKERLALHLSANSHNRYNLAVHALRLKALGSSAKEILALIHLVTPTFAELGRRSPGKGQLLTLSQWPQPGSALETYFIQVCAHYFAEPSRLGALTFLRDLVDFDEYNHLTRLLMAIQTAITWTATHPEISEAKQVALIEGLAPLIQEEPKLASYLGIETNLSEVERLHAEQAEDLRRELPNVYDLFMQAPIAVSMMKGPQHTYVLTNPWFSNSLLHRRELLGKTIRESYPELEGQGYFELLDRVYHTGEPFSGTEMPLTVIDTDGQAVQKYVNFSLQPLRGKGGRIEGIMSVAIDVTPQVQARQAVIESEARFRAIAESMPQLVWTAFPDGRVDYCNQRCLDYSGLSEKEIKGRGWSGALHPQDRKQVRDLWSIAAKEGKACSIEQRLRSRDGTYHWFLIQGVPVRNMRGEIYKWCGTCTDIHVHKRLQSALNRARQLAERASQTKSQFLANISHEIRTPLGCILGFTDILKDDSLSIMERHHYIEVIRRNGQALSRLIDDILDLSKVEAGHLKVESTDFNLADLIVEVTDIFRDQIKKKDIDLKFEIPAHSLFISSDPVRIRQILTNIIGNAVKFTERGQITVRAKTEPIPDDVHNLLLSLEVEDTGPGMTAAEAAKLFKPFTQGDTSVTRKFGGTGLGLALSRRLARALGGDVTISRSVPDQGSTFVVHFIVRTAIEKAPVETVRISPSQHGANLPLANKHILLVDDSADNQVYIAWVLKQYGAIVEVASNGAEGIKMASSGKFDIVLMDIQMPVMDGYRATAKLRRQGFNKPILAISAHAMNDERIKALKSGFNSHLSKPLHIKDLVETVANYVS